MKKISIAILLLVLVCSTLCACGNKEAETKEEPPKSHSIDISEFREVEPSPENLNIYRKEVSKKLEKEENFLSEDEKFIVENGMLYKSDFIHNTTYFRLPDESNGYYYYPVIYRTGDTLILWYTDYTSSVKIEPLSSNWRGNTNYLGELHSDDEDQEWLMSSIKGTLTYDKELGDINVWHLNQIQEIIKVPMNSTYCGYSHFEGHIFRSGTDVYAVDENPKTKLLEVACIAHDVKFVIDTDYRAASDPWSQPLFLMKDGSIQVYVSWEGDIDAPKDDESHLVTPYYEGGNGV